MNCSARNNYPKKSKCQLELTGGAQTKNKYTTTFECPAAQELYAQNTPLDDGVSSSINIEFVYMHFNVIMNSAAILKFYAFKF
jgi:hypothetical protein